MNVRITPVFDGHNDTLLRVYLSGPDKPYSFFAENPTGHLDLPRARKGGLVGGIFAIFTPTPEDSPEKEDLWETELFEGGYRQKLRSPIDPDYARTFTESVIDRVDELERESHGAVKLVKTSVELEDCIARGTLALVLHFEGAEAIREDLSNLEGYYQRGLRSIGLVWSRPNRFATGVPFAYPSSPDTGPGLTEAGKALVHACNRSGIVIDLAHLNEKGFWDVAHESRAPLVVSHADVHAICPSTRNLTDAQIDAVGRSGGVIGLNFEPIQITENANPSQDVPLAQFVKHVDYIANRIGVDHVAFGSDFDGTNMPAELRDAAGLQKLIQALHSAGYDEATVEKIAFRNWLRIFRDTWKENG